MKSVITLSDDTPGIVSYYGETVQGYVVKKRMDYRSFKKVFDNLFSDLESEWTLDGRVWTTKYKSPDGFLLGAHSKSGKKAIFVVPESKRLMRYEDETYYIVFPNMLFYFESQSGKLMNKFAYCFQGKLADLNADTQLLQYPFGNVNNSGDICFGGNSMEFNSYDDFLKAIEVFFSAKTNNDYFSGKKNNSGVQTQQGLLIKLSDFDEFPYQWLVPQVGMKYSHLENRILDSVEVSL